MQEVDYSVVVPVYNSEATLEELFKRTQSVFTSLKKSFEIIFVDDGGKDGSWEILQSLKKDFPDVVKAIKLTKNYGQHNAVLCGLSFCKGQQIITIDDDLQNPPEEIKKLIQKYEETKSDLVYGFYKKKKHSLWRNAGSKLVKRSGKAFQEGPGEGSSFRLIDKHLMDEILLHHQNFVFIDELFLWYTEDISFVEVAHESRKNNESGYTFWKLFKMMFNITIYYTTLPLKIMTVIGLISSVLSFGFAVRFLVRKLFFDVPLGYTSIIVTVLFSASLILFSLGIIGEYLNRIYIVQNKKPPYSIKKVLK
ncbi:MAG: glycosyltransferase family 2 protein [Bacteroidota bacterium]|nr:glycosyltransferase family 2 protein [Bacteroidota bacterium]